jgi:signal transduction histidine kinase
MNRAALRALVIAGALSVAGLVWIGYRAISGWQRSAGLVASRRAESAADLLVTALARDMRGVQTSVLSSPHRADPSDAHDLIASAFARYPYPDAFFASRAPDGERSLLFYARSDRPPAWMPEDRSAKQFPVAAGAAPEVAAPLLARIGVDAARGRGYSVFETNIRGARYQVVALLVYTDGYREHISEIFGFMVNLDWVRDRYFRELAAQIGRTAGAGSDLALAIHDDAGRAVVAPPPGVTPDAAGRRSFPLTFFDPALVAGAPSDLPIRDWTAQAIVAGDPTLLAANLGATRTLALAGITALLLGVALVLTVRAARASAALAEMRSEFVATVTHELKTPIATIRAVSETLASGRIGGPEAQREYAQMAVHEAKRLTRLIDNLLAYARVTDVTEVYSFEPIPVEEIIDETLRDFASKLKEGGFTVHVDTAAGLPPVRADRTAIGLSLANVIDNAIRYSGDGREVRVGAHGAGTDVTIQVSDRGVGIPDNEVEHVTRKFFRGRRATAGGSGLGLAIVRRIVTDHGGALSIQKQAGGGTTISITLPAALSA